MAKRITPGIFQLPRPSYQDRRLMQQQPAVPPQGVAPPQVSALPTGQPNMQLNEPVIGVGERTGQVHFRAGEVPEKIIFQPTQPGATPLPTPPQPLYNQFGQYRPPPPTTQPMTQPPQIAQSQPMPFAQGGEVQLNPNGTIPNINNELMNYLSSNPMLSAQDAQDLSAATRAIQGEINQGKLSMQEAMQAFQHFTSSLAPPQQMQQPQAGAPPPMPQQPIQQAQAPQPDPMQPLMQGQMNAPPQRTPAPSAHNMPYPQGPANKVPGNPNIPILPNSPAFKELSSPPSTMTNQKTPLDKVRPDIPMGGINADNIDQYWNDIKDAPIGGAPTPAMSGIVPGEDGIARVPDYVHGGQGQFDQNTLSAIESTFGPQARTAMHIASAESKGNAKAVGKAGEVGLFQIHPVNWPGLTRILGTPVNAQTLQDPMLNARAAKAILDGSQGNWQKDWTTAPMVLRALGGT